MALSLAEKLNLANQLVASQKTDQTIFGALPVKKAPGK
jgi:hypothetical protein